MNMETELKRTENDRMISRNSDPIFFFELERSLLLHLKDCGYLNEMQYRQAEIKLRKRYCISEKGEK